VAAASRREAIERREYDPRREERRKAARVALPDDVQARDLDPDARKDLRSLTKESAELVARHLVMAGRLLDDDPEQALAHARAARAMAARIGVVREATGLACYACEQWTEALAELRAARRITGRPDHLAVMADCERALGRPERALAYADDPEVPGLPQDERVELIIVLAGARSDLGQHDAAVLTLQDPAQRTTATRPWAARLWYAYADALLRAGRGEQAREWFGRVADVDTTGETDAVDRVLILDGVVLEDLDVEEEEQEVALPDAELADYISRTYSATDEAGRSAAELSESAPQVETPRVPPAGERPPQGTAPASPTPAPRVALAPTFETGESLRPVEPATGASGTETPVEGTHGAGTPAGVRGSAEAGPTTAATTDDVHSGDDVELVGDDDPVGKPADRPGDPEESDPDGPEALRLFD